MVRFAVLPRRLATKGSAGTVVVVAGGPGESSASQYAWAQEAFRPLLRDHDLLLVDNRGTGNSGAIDCPQAQRSSLASVAVAECRAILGSRADDYGTVAAADDLAAVLTRVHVRHVDMYGESYGTFVAQVFALRHPEHLQRLVLDGPVPLDTEISMLDSLPAGLADLRVTCYADPICRASGDPTALLGRALPRLRRGIPAGKTASGADDLAVLIANAGRAGSAYRELPAALRSYLAGDRTPLVRLANEASGGGAGDGAPTPTPAPVRTESEGLFLAVTCGDFPLPFNLRSPLAVQRRELDAAYQSAVRADSGAFLPFTPQEALRGEPFCLAWPAPTKPTPQSLKRDFPPVPTLVLEGALDTVTAPPLAHTVAREFRHSAYIQVPFVGHVAALKDHSGCAASIAAEFLAAEPTRTACLSHISAPPQVDAFPTTFAQETPVIPIGHLGATGLTTNDLRTIAIARDAVSDVLWRWARLQYSSGSGLRGGSFTTIPPLVRGDFSVHLSAIRWTTDTTVTGDLITSPTDHTLTGVVDVSTPTNRTRLDIQSPNIFGASTKETVSGTLDGHAIDLEIDAKLGL